MSELCRGSAPPPQVRQIISLSQHDQDLSTLCKETVNVTLSRHRPLFASPCLSLCHSRWLTPKSTAQLHSKYSSCKSDIWRETKKVNLAELMHLWVAFIISKGMCYILLYFLFGLLNTGLIPTGSSNMQVRQKHTWNAQHQTLHSLPHLRATSRYERVLKGPGHNISPFTEKKIITSSSTEINRQNKISPY